MPHDLHDLVSVAYPSVYTLLLHPAIPPTTIVRHMVRHNTDIVPTQYRHSPTTLSKITRRGRNPQNSKEQAVPRPSEAPQTPEIPVTTP